MGGSRCMLCGTLKSSQLTVGVKNPEAPSCHLPSAAASRSALLIRGLRFEKESIHVEMRRLACEVTSSQYPAFKSFGRMLRQAPAVSGLKRCWQASHHTINRTLFSAIFQGSRTRTGGTHFRHRSASRYALTFAGSSSTGRLLVHQPDADTPWVGVSASLPPRPARNPWRWQPHPRRIPGIAYDLDRLFRSERREQGNFAYSRAEASRILLAATSRAGMKPDDRQYVSRLVASQTGIAQPDAQRRVEEAVAAATLTVKRARQSGAILGFSIAVSLLLGAAAA